MYFGTSILGKKLWQEFALNEVVYRVNMYIPERMLIAEPGYDL